MSLILAPFASLLLPAVLCLMGCSLLLFAGAIAMVGVDAYGRSLHV